MTIAHLVDRSMKALIRQAPPAFFRLAGLEVDPAKVRLGDTSVVLPEFRADQVLFIGGDDDPDRWALLIEYQIQPDSRVVKGWILKTMALSVQLDIPVILVVLYLTRGRRKTFPSVYRVERGVLANQFSYHTIRLWEHKDRIRSGELSELAPLLVLCEDRPTEAVLREEREIIRRLDMAPAVKSDLFALAATLGARHFTRQIIQAVFREEQSLMNGTSLIEEWVNEGVEKGIEKRLEEARAENARALLSRILTKRFHELPVALVDRIAGADAEWCEALLERAVDAHSLKELGW